MTAVCGACVGISKHTLRVLAARFARGLHERCPSQREGAGNAGCALHPRSRVQDAQRKAHTSIQVQRKQSGIPCAMALRLMPCSPRRRIRLVTVAAGLRLIDPVGSTSPPPSLAPATGVGTTRFCRTQHQRRSSCALAKAFVFAPRPLTAIRPAITLRADAAASTASHPAFVTTRDPPLLPGKDGASW